MLTGSGSQDALPGPRPFGRRAGDQVALTDRQREVLELVADGLENKEIAGRLGISEQAAKQQVSVLLRKFGAPSRAVLARTALTMKLLGTGVHGPDVPVEYLCDRAPLLIAMTKGPEHVFVLVNRAFRELFGERAYIGHAAREVLPDTAAAVRAALESIYATGRAYRTNEQRITFALPGRAAHDVHLSFIAEPRRSADGAVDGVVFYGWDISEIVRIRERLHQLSAEQRVLLEQLPVGVIYTDEHARPVLVNGVARRILGTAFRPDRPLYEQGTEWNPRHASTGRPLAPSDMPSARATGGRAFDEEVIVTTREGGDIRINVSARPLHDENGVVTGAVIVISERTPAGAAAERAADGSPAAGGPADAR